MHEVKSKVEIEEYCACSECGGHVSVDVSARDMLGIVEGRIVCLSCGRSAEIRSGIIDWLPPENKEGGWKSQEFATLNIGTQYHRSHKEWLMSKHGYSEKIASAFELYQQAGMKGKLISWMDVPRRARILDIGCGVGYFLYAVVKAFPSCEMTCVGMDVCLRRLELFRRRVVEEQTRDFSLHCGDGEKMPFKGDTFDLVLMSEVMEHLADPRQAMREIHRVLKPGGAVYITTPNLQGGRTWNEVLGEQSLLRHPLIYLRQKMSRVGHRGAQARNADSKRDDNSGAFFDMPLTRQAQNSAISDAGFDVIKSAVTNRAIPLVRPLFERGPFQLSYLLIRLIDTMLPSERFGYTCAWKAVKR